MRPHRFINPGNDKEKTSAHNLRELNWHLSSYLHRKFISIKHSQSKLSYYDFSVYGLTLNIFWRDVHDNYPKIADAFTAGFPVFANDFDDMWIEVEDGIAKCQKIIGWVFSDFEKSVVRFEREKLVKTSSYDSKAFFNNWIIEIKKGENELLEIEGNKRTIFKLFFNSRKELLPFTITPDKLGIKGVMQAFPLQVFIQRHAIIRMKERLSEQFVHACYLNVFYAMASEPIPLNNKRSFLFPLTFGKAKLGYLKADIIGDKLVIRTFLFISNNGTPEGKKLQELFGLQKADKKYLGIDKLSTFILSDIKENKQLKKLFDEAGCGDLFKLDKTLLDNPKEKEIACANFIANYLGI